MSSSKFILLLIFTTVSLAIIWSLLSPETSKTTVVTTPQDSSNRYNDILNRIESLENTLNEQKLSQRLYQKKLDELEQKLTVNITNPPQATSIDTPLEQEDPFTDSIKPPTLQDKLVNSNIPLDTIQRIQQLVGKNRLARLQLRDQAIREDWIDSPEYFEKEQQLPGAIDGIREQFGDKVFDQYLYASGRPNRVLVREVYSGTAAQEAGIEPGDIIISYASDAIYAMSDLQQATTEGISGEPVLIEILRDDLPFSTSAPRGPLGISMTILRTKPE